MKGIWKYILVGLACPGAVSLSLAGVHPTSAVAQRRSYHVERRPHQTAGMVD